MGASPKHTTQPSMDGLLPALAAADALIEGREEGVR